MASQDSKSTVKYSEWRPIGVCDTGPPNIRKAKIFTASDLSIIKHPGINRDNWDQHPKVLKIINKYARDVAKISPETTLMKKPVVSKVTLVGAVLQFSRTPGLNQESEEGKVQFFQVEFKDANTQRKKRRIWVWLLATFIFLVSFTILIILMTSIQTRTSRKMISFCGTSRSSNTYSQHLREAQQEIGRITKHIKRMSTSYDREHQLCFPSGGSIGEREQQLLTCYNKIKRGFTPTSEPFKSKLGRVGRCIHQICVKQLPHLKSQCKRL